MPRRNPCRLDIHLAFTYFVGPSRIVWSERGPAPPLPLMRVCEVYWSHALSLVCETALKWLVFFNKAPAIDWYVVRWGSKSKHDNKDTCWKKIMLNLQRAVKITLHWIEKIIGRIYLSNLGIDKHALPIFIPTSGDVRFSLWFLQLFHLRFANATRVLLSSCKGGVHLCTIPSTK